MSYERMREDLQQATCACGRGKVIRTYYYEMDDWNRTRDGYEGEEINCDACKTKYHIESTEQHYSCPKWKGDGIVTNFFLVPNGKTLHPAYKNSVHFSYQFKDRCVSDFPLDTLNDVLIDMRENKYSTRLSLEASKKIVKMYYQSYKKKSLPAIIGILQACVDNYYSFEWTYEKKQEYDKELQKEIEERHKMIDEVLSESYPLNFK